MTKLKDKLLLIIGAIILIAACGLTAYFLFFKTSDYYVQIDNTDVKIIKQEYEYTLRTYDEHGKMKDLTFKANKKLREDAYLKLQANPTRGVIYWEEVTFDELPKDVQFRYDTK